MDLPGSPIDHLVILCMENRSFDHFLGSLALEDPTRAIDGLKPAPYAIPDNSGKPVSNWQMDPTLSATKPGFPDLPHGLSEAHADWNNGKNDGFVQTYQLAHSGQPEFSNIPMGYYTRTTLSVLHSLADKFVVCDRWHGSVLSSTWPNRKYMHSGRRDDDGDTQIVPGISGFQTTPIYDLIAKHQDPATGQPLTWRSYFCDIPFLGFWYGFTFRNLRNFETIDAFSRDCVQNTLPTISIIDPPFSLADDHPPHDPLMGEKFIGLVVDALTNSPSWYNSALLILYDEFGGFFDHVPPPAAPEPNPTDTPLGFRVPALIVSPYAKKRYVSHVTYDHTSIMRTISDRWNIDFAAPGDPFGTRWRHIDSIWGDAFDFQAPARDCGVFTGEPVRDVNWGTGVRERLGNELGRFEAALERIFVLPELKALDRRASVFETMGKFEHDVISLKRNTGYELAKDE